MNWQVQLITIYLYVCKPYQESLWVYGSRHSHPVDLRFTEEAAALTQKERLIVLAGLTLKTLTKTSSVMAAGYEVSITMGCGLSVKARLRYSVSQSGIKRLLKRSRRLRQKRTAALKQTATTGLDLIHQKSQQHQMHQHRGEVLIAMTKVMLEVIALVFQGIKGLVFDAPSRSTRPHHSPV